MTTSPLASHTGSPFEDGPPPDQRRRRTAALLQQAQRTPDELARRRCLDEVVSLHLPIARGLARRASAQGVSYDALADVAVRALRRAVHDYDAAGSGEFAGFAVPRIRAALRTLSAPAGWTLRSPHADRQSRVVTGDWWGGPAAREHEQERIETCAARLTSALLGRPVHAGDPAIVTPLPAKEVRRRVAAVLATLERRDLLVLEWRYVDGLSPVQVARLLGVDRDDVAPVVRRLLAPVEQALRSAR